MGKKRSTFLDFVEKNEELVEEYEQVVGEDLWSLPIQDIEELAAAIAFKLKIGFSSVLNNCVNLAIQNRESVLKVLSDIGSSDGYGLSTDSSLQKYFKEINDIYTKNNNDYDIPFTEENRERIISMNLKSVISIAKCYQGLGVDFQDLIGAGNEGLCHAFKKYDPKRACLKDDLLNAIESTEKTEFTYDEIVSIVNEYLTYGEKLKQSFDSKFKEGKIYKKNDIVKWVDKNIQNAKFNSVACKWIKAFIIQEINNNSRVVKKPKTEIDKDRKETGAYKKETIVNIDAPVIGDDNSKTVGDMMYIEDDSIDRSSLENEENYKVFKQGLNTLLTGVKSRDRRIILKKFGIGMIRPLQPIEIAAQEDLSVARISQIINCTIETMIENSKKYRDQIDTESIFMALNKLV
jgi:RNA polymerase sigma factor (sigma-70 family)